MSEAEDAVQETWLRYAADILGGQVQMIRSVSNPDKLRHMGSVANAWAADREMNQAYRPTD